MAGLVAALRRTPTSATAIHITALDGIVHVNSLFTFAAFVGLTWNPSTASGGSSHAGISCDAGVRAVEHLVSFHVLAFACFLFSSIVALCLKLAISGGGAVAPARINRAALRIGIATSTAGSALAVGFLMLALVNLVRLRLGKIGCSGGEGGAAAVAAVVTLLTLVPSAMLIYVGIVLYAFTR